jgi:ATP-dependent DNA helicase PIF1
MGGYILEGRVISGSNIGEKMYIPRLALTPSDTRIPFKFQRKQFPIFVCFEFPIFVCFAMTINKSQGNHLSKLVYISHNLSFRMGSYMLQYHVLHQGMV